MEEDAMSRTVVLTLAAVLLLAGLSIGAGSTVMQAQDAQEVEAENGRKAIRPASYINPDTGLATENPNVNRNSECRTPDQADRQIVSAPGTTTKNVHNDACLFRDGKRFDGMVSFEIRGAGTFNACPDPDGSGPKTAAVKRNGKWCAQTGYQEKNMAGDLEYHARINHTGRPDTRTIVTFCHDPEGNGCRDARLTDTIAIEWVGRS
jgi:hypothetical protein